MTRNAVLQGFLWDFSGKLARQGVTFVLSIFMTRLLLPQDFGLMAMIGVIIAFSSAFMNTGLSVALIQKRDTTEVHYSSVFFTNVFLGALLTILLYQSAEYIAHFYNDSRLVDITKVASFNFIVNSLIIVQTAKLKKAMNFAIRTRADFFAAILSGVIGLTLALNGFGVWSLVVQVLFNNLIFAVFLWLFSSWKPHLVFSWKALKELWLISFNIFITGILNRLSDNIDVVLIGKFFGTSEVGLFNRAKSLNLFVIRFTSESLGAVLFPFLSNLQEDLIQYKKVVLDALSLISFVTFGLLGVLYLIAEPLIITLYTVKWIGSVLIFKLLILSAYGYPIIAIISEAIKGQGKSILFLKVGVLTKGVFLIGIGIGFIYGFVPFLYAIAIVTFINCLIYLFTCSYLINSSFCLVVKSVFFYLVCATACVCVITLTLSNFPMNNIEQILILSCTFGLLYLLANYIASTKGLQLIKENIRDFYKNKRKI